MALSRIERDDLCFTLLGGGASEVPLPFVAGGRTVLLLEEPASCQTARTGPTVAILGFGLGAVGAIMARLRPRARIVGVEASQRLVATARRHLPAGVELRHCDALAFLRRTRLRFDLVFDDCFELRGTAAVRPPELLQHAALVHRRLRPAGIYVRNLLPQGRLAPAEQVDDLERTFRSVRLRRFRDYDNVFAIASDCTVDRHRLRQLTARR